MDSQAVIRPADINDGVPRFVEPDETDAQDALSRLLQLAHTDQQRTSDADTATENLTARLVSLARELIPSAESCAIAMASVGTPIEVLPGSDSDAADVIEAQFLLAEGPALDLLGRHGTVRIADTRAETRWPRLCAKLAEMGARSVAAVDLPATKRSRGIIAFSSASPRAFGAVTEFLLPVFASRASAEFRRRDNVENLTNAIERRQFVGQAVGILMERHRIDAEAAFQQLVQASQKANVKLHVIAGRVIETGQEPDGIFTRSARD